MTATRQQSRWGSLGPEWKRVRVRFHGANAISRYTYARWWGYLPTLLYYRIVRQFLTRIYVSEDAGCTWKRLC